MGETRDIPAKIFNVNDASFEKFLNFKRTYGIVEKIPNYTVQIVDIDGNNFKRIVETDIGFTGILRIMVNKLIGTTSIIAVENIYYDLDKKEYKCVIDDPNEGKYRNYFSFHEEYEVFEKDGNLTGTVNVQIQNNLPSILASWVEKSFFAQRHSKLKDELYASKLYKDNIPVFETNPSQDNNKSQEQIQEELSQGCTLQLQNTQEYEYFFGENNEYIPNDNDIPL